ncbi:MAG: NAD(P)/FAD-dependent oxidoreductase [Chloroflexota bacterium]
MPETDVVIIGAGPAGLAAAIQLQRYGIPFVLLEKGRVGGLLWNANLVENYPGFPAGVSGPKLVRLIEKQASRIGVRVLQECVLRVVTLDNIKNIYTINTNKNTYTTTHIIIASGTKPRPTPIPIPTECAERVYSDVWPLLGESGKRIVIVGAGDAAFDYALNLTKNRNSVTILNRGGDVKCLRLLWERARANPAVTYRAECPVSGVEAAGTAGRLRVRCEAGESLEADALLFAIGRVPQVDFLSAELLAQAHPGLHFVGDVKNGLYRQAAIAAGDGLRAAMEIYFSMEA